MLHLAFVPHDPSLARIVRENADFLASHTDTAHALSILNDELSRASEALIRDPPLLPDPHAPPEEVTLWNNVVMKAYAGKTTWLSTPFLPAEFYYYRRIIEAFNWYELQHDPFGSQKVFILSLSLSLSVSTFHSTF